MCGIAGALALHVQQSDLRATAARMAARLIHRGPDAGGVWGEDGVALSHRRLAVIELSEAGAQPMLSACGRLAIVFNGEIYNHLDLRSDLEEAGAAPAWNGQSDTETLLAGISHWGIEETLRRCAGMFAMALWDRSRRRLTLARDRMGEKPLYWGWAGRDLVFASELKALRTHPECPREISQAALVQYLALSYIPSPLCIHPGLYKLDPGCLLEVDAEALPTSPPALPLRPGDRMGGLTIRRYWSIKKAYEEGSAQRLTDDEDALDELAKTLEVAVTRQMMADVPLGAFLSGGIDSALICTLMQRQSTSAIRTFSVGFEAQEFDESPYAAAIARHLGTNHTELFVSKSETRDVIPQLVELYDEPFADSSQIPTYLICRAARRSVKVALSGDGGDELFGGYNKYVRGPHLWARMRYVPFALRQGLAEIALAVPQQAWNFVERAFSPTGNERTRNMNWGPKVHRIAGRLKRVQTLQDLYTDMTRIWPDPLPLLADGGVRLQAGARVDSRSALEHEPDFLASDPSAQMMVLDMSSYLPDDILCKVDRAAMAVGLETRVPFLDPDVIAISGRLPTTMKIRQGQSKWALRRILDRHFPREMFNRPKAGFSIPLGASLRGPLRPWAEDLLNRSALARDGLLNPDPIRATWTEHLSGQADRSNQIWAILMLMAWRDAQR